MVERAAEMRGAELSHWGAATGAREACSARNRQHRESAGSSRKPLCVQKYTALASGCHFVCKVHEKRFGEEPIWVSAVSAVAKRLRLRVLPFYRLIACVVAAQPKRPIQVTAEALPSAGRLLSQGARLCVSAVPQSLTKVSCAPSSI